MQAFRSDLVTFDWQSVLVQNDINKSFDNYMSGFSYLYDKHFPVKTFTYKEKHHNKPYITAGIRKSIKHRNKLQKLYAKWPLTYGTQFKRYRNTLTATIKAAKDNYYKSKLTQHWCTCT